MILGILIALQMKNVNVDTVTEQRIEELLNSLVDYTQKNEELSKRNAELFSYIELLENDYATGNEYIETIIRERERAAIFAGLREVSNFGITIRISCAPDVMIRDSVIRQFVNELRALGAQAISVNDERLVAMSEIRASNQVIIINGKNFDRQTVFEIKAIIDPAKEEYFMSYLNTVKQTVLTDLSSDQYDIAIQSLDELTIPALNEDSIAFKIDLLMPKAQ
jgi:uncharacterized protein YlxW (UPF0749 family)